jgi:regulator of nucleoside diphosphate kinase
MCSASALPSALLEREIVMLRSIPEELPRIVVSDVDHERLTRLAEGLQERAPRLAEALQHEMDRAVVVSAESVPSGVVQMGSTVLVRFATGEI